MRTHVNDVGDTVCEHGTAVDVHCCHCHSGFMDIDHVCPEEPENTVIPLTKTLDPADYALLEPELRIVEQHWDGSQHEHRRFEYAMALRAVATWQETHHGATCPVVDVGGFGSPFAKMLDEWIGAPPTIVDPKMNRTLAEFVHENPPLADVVTCLSVIEHIENLDEFLYHLSCLVAPGGLLFLTMDCWNKEGPDTAHFHWDRRRIFSMWDWKAVSYGLQKYDFRILGDADWRYHGDHICLNHDHPAYSFATLALVKRS